MIAYSQQGLDHLYVLEQAQDALDAGCITAEENANIRKAYPGGFYTPNVFICIGLFVLTTIIVSCSMGLFILVSSVSSDSSVSKLIIFLALACYAALEFTVHTFRHLRSGVDYALLWLSAGLLYAGIDWSVNNMSGSSQSMVVCLISLFFALRFANILMALIAYMAFLTYVFLTVTSLSITDALLLPFILMAISIIVCLISVRLRRLNICRHYRDSLIATKIASLVSFYLAGNYFVVRELNSYVLGNSVDHISMGWLFWMLTVATPVFYICLGIRKKDHLFLWTGLGLVAAAIFTIRYYYHLMPVEWELLCGGAVMIAMAYGLIRYLKTPQNGFTSKESNDRHLLEKLNIESLIIAETFAGTTNSGPAAKDFEFGGGSGGGGGAGGQF